MSQFKYYRDVINSEKPYGLVRGMRKFLYSSKSNQSNKNTRKQPENTTTVKGDGENSKSVETSFTINVDQVNTANAIGGDIENNTSPKQPVNTEQLQSAPTNESSDGIEIDTTYNSPDVSTVQSESVPTIKILDVIEYVPIVRFSIVITIFSMHLYKLTDMTYEMFKDNGYSNFPNVYRFFTS